jgi:hypothetical protein
MNRISLIKQIHQRMIRSNINKGFYNSLSTNFQKVETIGVENAPYINWSKEVNDIDKDIREQIFG